MENNNFEYKPEENTTPNGGYNFENEEYDFENEAKAVMERLYPGYVLQKCQVRYSDIVDGVYIRCVLRRRRR